MSLRCKLENVVLFKRIFFGMTGAVRSFRLEMSKDGLSVFAMDSAHVSLTVVNFNKERFINYDYTMKKPTTGVGILTEKLATFLEYADSVDSLEIEYIEGKKFLTLEIVSPDKLRICQYVLSTMEYEGDELSVPETDYSGIAVVNLKNFFKIMNTFTKISDVFSIWFKDWGIELTCVGRDGSTLRICLKEDAEEEKEKKIPKTMKYLKKKVNNTKMWLSTRYVTMFSKMFTMDDDSTVVLKLENSSPFCAEFGDGAFTFYLAPRIDEAEDETNGFDKDKDD